MILISPLLDRYFRTKFQNRKTRRNYFERALRKELRSSRLGQVALRNLNEMMAENPSWHNEFAQILGDRDYQSAFWESDLGYLWYQGNLSAQNTYFGIGLEHIKKEQYSSVLDIGCGWGEFISKAAAIPGVTQALGIDIAEDIIKNARELHPNASFEHKNISDINENFDLVTLYGSTDYIPPSDFRNILSKILSVANKEVIIVNSLRKIPFENARELKESIEVKRYDTGYVHPISFVLEQLKNKFSIHYTTQKAGTDSVLVVIKKK